MLSADRAHIEVFNDIRPAVSRDCRTRYVSKLERRWRDATGRANAMACRSGTVALRLAIASLELEAGDEVICPADAGHLVRALSHDDIVAVPVDLDPKTHHIDPAAVDAAIGDRTRAVIAVDKYGSTANYRVLTAIGRRSQIAVIEDGSQSLGAEFDHRPVGSLGDISIYSLHGDAGSALGIGGLYATDDDRLAAIARRSLLVISESRNVGGAMAPIPEQPSIERDLFPLSNSVCQLSELDAVVGDAQLRRIGDESLVRAENGIHLRGRLSAVPGILVPEAERGSTHVYSSLPLVVVPDELGLAETVAHALRDVVVDTLVAEGLEIDRWRPEPGPGWGAATGCMPVVEDLSFSGLVVGQKRSPFGPPHTIETMERIAECFFKVFVDNVDRLRQLTLERFHSRAMT
ncbi:MAG: DegT/DnrJ/EryC1/StrS family aminotransferase [Actinomycetia bacterium]|nr:DegT/DnrJ/EryC1/StrS family aminotransferase [Actinomycetes bacterium]